MKAIKLAALMSVVAVVALLTGCRKHYINGDLDGQWQVLTIEYKSDGHVDDVKASQVYYCFNLHTVHLRQVKALPSAVLGNMKYDKKTIGLEFPLVKDASELSAWGMNAVNTSFAVKSLSHERLVMESDYAVISCRKF
ncbi:MAG: lipocalin-like domain-containing protein [Muribaculum sp.]|nr:lipocalin-like domain-containing protein [Muribaculum sp.]